jgi:hypothetical protein
VLVLVLELELVLKMPYIYIKRAGEVTDISIEPVK